MSEDRKEKRGIKMPKFVKALLLAGIINPLNASCSQPQKEDKKPQKNTASQNIKHQLELIRQEQRVDSVRKTLQNLPRYGIYNGVKIDYAKLKPQDIGHIFESGMNPLAMNAHSIKDADFLGYYQMSLDAGGLMSKFVAAYGSKYPDLKGKGLKTQEFFKAYASYAKGEKAVEFHADMFELNYSKVYKEIFEKLALKTPDIPLITQENCADPQLLSLAGAVMSCANQNPSKTVAIFSQAYLNSKKSFGTMDISKSPELFQSFINSVVSESYGIRRQKWGLQSRYTEEKKLASQSSEYLFSKSRYEEEVAKLKECYRSIKYEPLKLSIPQPELPVIRTVNVGVQNIARFKKHRLNG